MPGFDDLTPALQTQIVSALGWTSLRPVQHAAIDAILPGHTAVILAPTAGGKTEASLFPVLSRMVDEDWRPVSVLYLAPIRALLNNQEARLTKLTGLLGRRAAKWHGDVNAAARKRIVAEPPDLLAITPESVEALLLSTSRPGKRLLGNVRAVVIDEVHAFAADDRGAHLMCLLERLTHLSKRPIQRIGLSATVGDPDAIAHWLRGSNDAPAEVVDPARGAPREADVRLDFVGPLENAAVVIDRAFRASRRLVFADSRRTVEALGEALIGRGATTFVSHSSLSPTQRRQAEQAFEEGDDCVIVATSALELGIDVGDLDHVLQIDAPGTVSSFLQRMGRTGRRVGTTPNCTFLCRKDGMVLQAAGLLRLWRRGFVEPTAPSSRAPHILAHQLMALSLQEHGVPTGGWRPWLGDAAPLQGIPAPDVDGILDAMLTRDILFEADARFVLGPEGEKRYGRRNFLDMYAVFSTPPILRVFWGAREIGSIDAWFAQQDETLTFVLAGQPWRIVSVQWRRGTCSVEPAAKARLPRWMGSPVLLSRELCTSMRDVLVTDTVDPWWTKRATAALTELREANAYLADEPAPLVRDGDTVRWETWAGGRANGLLAALLQAELGDRVSAENRQVRMTGHAADSDVAIRKALRALRDGELDVSRAMPYVAERARTRLSKFQPCLPEDVELSWLATRLFDLDGARAALDAATL